MIEFIKILGAAIISAVTTVFCLYLQRKWKKQDVKEERDDEVIKRLDKLTVSIERVSNLLNDHIKENEEYVDSSEEIRTALKSGMREVLYDIIKTRSYQYELDGRIREEDYRSIKRMWTVYHTELDGNGFLDGRMEVVESLDKY